MEDNKSISEDADQPSEESTVTTTASSATIFVGNLPFDTRDDQLEKVFSEIGPIKRAFIVKDKDNRSKSRGCGYVQFVLQEDADKCVKATKTIGNRQLRLNYAAKKPKHAKRKLLALQKANENADQSTGETVEKENSLPEPKKVKVETDQNIQNISGKTDLQRTIVLTGLTAKVKRKAFRVMCEQFGEIETIVYPVPERDEVTAFVRYKEYKGAIRATQKIPGKKVKKSGVLSACLLTKEGKMPTKKKLAQARLIVRNLSFKCEDEDLRQQFSKFGKVVSVNIPTKKVKNKDVKIGCGFVQFAETANAKVALAEMNLKEIMDRQVVVDWAVAKNMYTAEKQSENDNEKSKDQVEKEKEGKERGKGEKGGKKKETDKKKKETGKKKDDEDEEEEEEEDEDNIGNKSEDDDDEEEEVGEDNDAEDEDSDDEGDDEEDENMSENEEEGGNDSEDEDNEDEDMDEQEEEDIEDNDDEAVQEKPKKQLKDAKEGRTIFIRNLSYNVDEGILEEEFEKYGDIEYCKIVMDQESGRPKGTAFIKFKEKKSCDECVQEFVKKFQAGINWMLDNRAIVISLAVTKGKLGEIQQEKSDSKKESDKRNLYLASEGIVTRNSPAAEGLSDADLKKREKALMEKKAKLKNPNYFVSRTRLCIRNLPLTADADSLTVALKKFVPSEVKVGKVKIMRSNERRDLSGKPRSLGFGFIEMDTHEHALTLLRSVNNNPKVFGDQRRPIVEFSVENAKALKILELKKKRLDAKQQQLAEHGNDGSNEKEESKITPEEKKAMYAKAYEKKKKRFARYKKKKEAKKLANNSNELSGNDNTTNKSVDKSRSAPAVAENKQSTMNKTVALDHGLERTNESAHKVDQPSRKSKKKAAKEEAKFSSMVEQYKQKILGTAKVTAKKQPTDNRWFE